jgi:hypothetical protein
MDNPNREEEYYMERILPPVFISSELSTSVAPPKPEYAKLSAEEYRNNPKAKLPSDLHYNTELSIQPYVTKSELHELIDEYWPEIKDRINQRTTHGDKIFGTKLLGKVQPTKIKKAWERDNLIMELHNAGIPNDKILYELSTHKSQFSVPSADYLRVIISRNKKNTD